MLYITALLKCSIVLTRTRQVVKLPIKGVWHLSSSQVLNTPTQDVCHTPLISDLQPGKCNVTFEQQQYINEITFLQQLSCFVVQYWNPIPITLRGKFENSTNCCNHKNLSPLVVSKTPWTYFKCWYQNYLSWHTPDTYGIYVPGFQNAHNFSRSGGDKFDC